MTTKTCNGPTHKRPTPLPLSPRYWYFHKKGQRRGRPLSKCKACSNAHKTYENGYIPCEKVLPLAQELLLRFGGNSYGALEATSKYSGIHRASLWRLLNNRYPKVRKATAHKIILALYNKRREDRKNRKLSPQFKQQILFQAKREQQLQDLMGY